MMLVLKAHPIRFPGAASPAQAKAGNYRKRKVAWQGLTISIENEAGTIRRGKGWETRMVFPYGEIMRTEGVDGDPVDVILGPNLDAPMVYVVHQRRYGDWENYDEDKCCVGFLSEDEARHAFLANYNDPRFLGPITAMPVAEFVEKAKATKENPIMIKSFVFKSVVDPYIRGGRLVRGYTNRKVVHTGPDTRQQTFIFVEPAPKQPAPPPETKKFYVTVIRNPGPNQRVGFLAGPFATHEEALAKKDEATRIAGDVDPETAFDYFGTSGLTLPEGKHPPGKLNTHLGISTPQ